MRYAINKKILKKNTIIMVLYWNIHEEEDVTQKIERKIR